MVELKGYIGVIKEVLDPDLYTVLVDIPESNQGLKAFPIRGEVDEPRVGDVVFLRELDPLYHSYYLYEKLKENGFIGIRARGKVLRMSESEVVIGIFDPSTEYYDSNDGSDPTPEPTSYIKIDASGNINITAETDQNVTITGNCTVNISGDANITVSGNVNSSIGGALSSSISGNADITVGGSTTLSSPNVTITGGNLNVSGTAGANSLGPFCAIPVCPLSGATHGVSLVSGT